MDYTWDGVLDTLYGGVNFSLPGNGGPECRDFLPPVQRLFENYIAVGISLIYVVWGLTRLSELPNKSYIREDRGGRRLLLVLISLVFGTEVAYKFATRQVIFLLNPCHMTTLVQIILLSMPPSVYSTVLFRVHLGFINGAVLALLFPVTNTLMLPFEVEVFWIQHLLMLVVPYYLLRLGGVYNIEPLGDISWVVMSLGIQVLYNFVVLQAVSAWSMANLNSILCPAVSDPFYGPWYRVFAFIHQSLVIPLCCKLYCLIANFFITQFGPTAVKSDLSADVTEAARMRQNAARRPRLSPRCVACGHQTSTNGDATLTALHTNKLD